MQLQEIISKAHFSGPTAFHNKIIRSKDYLFKFNHVDGSSRSGTGYSTFYMNDFFWRQQHLAMSNQHDWSFQKAIQCYKTNFRVSINECIIIWSSILHIKPLWTLIPRILTYADLDPRPLDVFAWIEEALVIILQIASDNTKLTLIQSKMQILLKEHRYNCAFKYLWSSKIPHTRVKGHMSRLVSL